MRRTRQQENWTMGFISIFKKLTASAVGTITGDQLLIKHPVSMEADWNHEEIVTWGKRFGDFHCVEVPLGGDAYLELSAPLFVVLLRTLLDLLPHSPLSLEDGKWKMGSIMMMHKTPPKGKLFRAVLGVSCVAMVMLLTNCAIVGLISFNCHHSSCVSQENAPSVGGAIVISYFWCFPAGVPSRQLNQSNVSDCFPRYLIARCQNCRGISGVHFKVQFFTVSNPSFLTAVSTSRGV